MKRLLVAVAVVLVCLVAVTQWGWPSTPAPNKTGVDQEAASVANTDADFARAFADRAGGLELEGQGTVSKLLADDTDGDRHQRFVVRLDSGQTLLVAHNIDVAPRVSALRLGDTVSFKGEYEWNEQGGIMHWTHHDPTGNHAAGWIRHEGRTYQ